MTTRLADWIGQQSLKRTFSAVADEVGVTEGAIRHVFRAHVDALSQQIKFETPRWLGIDEIHLIKPRGVVTNVEHNTVVEILSDRNKRTVINYLSSIRNRDHIERVAMDMWVPYRDAARLMLPQAQIVVDKFHVLRMANQAMETVRKSLRASLTARARRGLMHDRFVLLKRHGALNDQERLLLSGWLVNYPELGLAYQLKEQLFEVYDARDFDDGMDRLRAWRRAVTPEVATAFQPVVTALGNWEPEIMAYFHRPITNAYTESLNNLIRVTNRMGRGYSFEALRAKILYTEGVQKIRRPAFERRPSAVCEYMSFGAAAPVSRLGADISTLSRFIEGGQI